MKKYIDIHAHKKNSAKNLKAVLNLFPGEKPESGALYSAGLHPWLIKEENIVGDMRKVEKLLKFENVIAVGETGLDRACKVSFELQEKIFLEHIKLADELQLPLIIHCVRSYPDLIHFKKTEKSSVPWIIHGFNGNKLIAEQLLEHGFYFSFGIKNLEGKSQVFCNIPSGMIFLETDESDFNIKDVYEKAAEIKNLETENLLARINENFEKIFGSTIR